MPNDAIPKRLVCTERTTEEKRHLMFFVTLSSSLGKHDALLFHSRGCSRFPEYSATRVFAEDRERGSCVAHLAVARNGRLSSAWIDEATFPALFTKASLFFLFFGTGTSRSLRQRRESIAIELRALPSYRAARLR